MLNKVFSYTISGVFALSFLTLCGVIFFTFMRNDCAAADLCLGKFSQHVDCATLEPPPAPPDPTLDYAWGICQAHMFDKGEFPWTLCLAVRNAMEARDRASIERALKGAGQ